MYTHIYAHGNTDKARKRMTGIERQRQERKKDGKSKGVGGL